MSAERPSGRKRTRGDWPFNRGGRRDIGISKKRDGSKRDTGIVKRLFKKFNSLNKELKEIIIEEFLAIPEGLFDIDTINRLTNREFFFDNNVFAEVRTNAGQKYRMTTTAVTLQRAFAATRKRNIAMEDFGIKRVREAFNELDKKFKLTSEQQNEILSRLKRGELNTEFLESLEKKSTIKGLKEFMLRAGLMKPVNERETVFVITDRARELLIKRGILR